jgi:hypothetical protein
MLTGMAGVLVSLASQRDASAQEPVPICAENPIPATASAPGEQRAALVLIEGQRTTLAFGRDRGLRSLQLQFEVTGCEFSQGDIKNEFGVQYEPAVGPDLNQLSTEGRTGSLGFVEGRARVTFRMDIDPRDNARAGHYELFLFPRDARAAETPRVPQRLLA